MNVGAGEHRGRQALDSTRRKQCLLERGEGVEHVGRRFDRHLCVMDERRPCLLLQRAEPGVVLITALPVGAVGILSHDRDPRSSRRPDRQLTVRTRDGHVEHGNDGTPEVD